VSELPDQVALFEWLECLTLNGAGIGGKLSLASTLHHLVSLCITGTNINDPLPLLGSSQFMALENLTLSQNPRITVLPNFSIYSSIRFLDLSRSSFTGTLPESIFNMSNLSTAILNHCHWSGSIPESLRFATNLNILHLDNNALSGAIPDAFSQLFHLSSFQAQNNTLSGPLPYSLRSLQSLQTLNLARNHLSGSIPPFILSWSHLVDINLSNNRFSGSFPSLKGASWQNLIFLSLSGNMLNGTFPDLPHSPMLRTLELDYNLLEGLPFNLWDYSNLEFISARMNALQYMPFFLPPSLKYLDLSFNVIMGTISDLPDTLEVLNLRRNALFGTIPDLKRILTVDVANNRLSDWGTLFTLNRTETTRLVDLCNNLFAGALPSNFPQFQTLVMSGNFLNGTIPAILDLGDNLFHRFDFSNNSFSGTLPMITAVAAQIVSLDFRNNHFVGTIPIMYGSIPALETLYLSGNYLTGDLSSLLPGSNLLRLHIDFNQFDFHAAQVERLPALADFSARSNLIHGSLSLLALQQMQYLDLSENKLDEEFDLHNLVIAFHAQDIRFLSLSRNPLLPSFKSLEGLIVKRENHPADHFPLVTCFELTFNSTSPVLFEYDDIVFSYLQCNCSAGYFGVAPNNCFVCPEDSHCDGPQVNMESSNYMYRINSFMINMESSSITTKRDTKIFSILPQLGNGDNSNPSRCSGPIGVEDCQIGPLSDLSNCIGTSAVVSYPNFALNLTIPQCLLGSEGRKCSKCTCVAGSHSCYYQQGTRCKKCKFIFSSSKASSLFVSLGFLLFIILSIVLYFLLRSKRQTMKKPWERLSIPKRVIYRFRHLASLGIPSILISFVQLYAELTKYDMYAARAWLQLTSGQTDGLGLACVLPLARSPIGRLSVRLFVPLIFVLIVACGCAISAFVFHLVKRKRCCKPIVLHIINDNKHSKDHIGTGFDNDDSRYDEKKVGPIDAELASAYSTENDLVSESDDESLEDESKRALLSTSSHSIQGTKMASKYSKRFHSLSRSNNHSKNIGKEFGKHSKEETYYSAFALLSSVTIMVLRFFYFSVAIASTEYFFNAVQDCTGISYIQSHPWMHYEDAKNLRSMSIPFLVLFVVGLPACFAFVLFWFWRRLSSTLVDHYIGGLISRYKQKFCWWELVLVARKLGVALVSRGVDEQDALFSGALFLILTSHLLLQVIFKPWKRKCENTLEIISSILLILSLAAVQGGIDGRYHSSTWQVTVLVLVIIFALSCISFIIYLAINEKTDYQRLWERDYNLETEQADSALHESSTSTGFQE
jgi:Leucine-rich repeat (LRR) protein